MTLFEEQRKEVADWLQDSQFTSLRFTAILIRFTLRFFVIRIQYTDFYSFNQQKKVLLTVKKSRYAQIQRKASL